MRERERERGRREAQEEEEEKQKRREQRRHFNLRTMWANQTWATSGPPQVSQGDAKGDVG